MPNKKVISPPGALGKLSGRGEFVSLLRIRGMAWWKGEVVRATIPRTKTMLEYDIIPFAFCDMLFLWIERECPALLFGTTENVRLILSCFIFFTSLSFPRFQFESSIQSMCDY